MGKKHLCSETHTPHTSHLRVYPLVCLCVHYLVGVSMCKRCVVLARAVGGPVFVHGGGGRGFVQ